MVLCCFVKILACFRKTLELFAGSIPSFSTRTEPNRCQRSTATVVSSPAFPANKGCSQASKLRSRGDLFRRCDASGQRQRRTKTPRRLGTHVWNWHLQPIRPEPARDPAKKCPVCRRSCALHSYPRRHGAGRTWRRCKRTMTSIDGLPAEAFKWSEHGPPANTLPQQTRASGWSEEDLGRACLSRCYRRYCFRCCHWHLHFTRMAR
jgi:hypothetical protein